MTILQTGQGTHITLRETPNPKRKTKLWVVRNRYDNGLLGHVAWFTKWRKYGFYPEPETVYEEVCMRELATFCQGKTQEHKKQ